ncbi:centrosomal protein of 131 kDa isoform X5 [Xenopus laevis]|uniref:Centrosomal protein of 131 kDa isoform X5 n=1 Tax=Xenopus laevis TaxID=8355 RepID=A0A8J1LSA7_XENLA|nr:centrosomal protein of 131 kDa isoform X5 [Xenopus laevis]
MQSSFGPILPQDGGNNRDLALTGSQVSVTRRPSSAGSTKHITRSVSVITDCRSKGNSLKDSPRAINNLRRSNSTTQVPPENSSAFRDPQDEFLAFFESSSIGRKKLDSLVKASPEKKTTWNVLDEQTRVFPVPSTAQSSNSAQSLSLKKRDTLALAPSFTANNRSNKGAVGNMVTTMVHNNYGAGERGLSNKSSNQRPASLNNLRSPGVEDSGSNFQKFQKNLSNANNLGRNNAGGGNPQKRKEVTAEEAEIFIQQVNNAAVTIQRWYRRLWQKRRSGEETLKHLLASKKEERQQKMEEGNILTPQQSKEEERRRVREEKARQARRAAIQELQQKRSQKALETQRLAEEETQRLVQSGKVGRKKTVKNPVSSPLGNRTKANNTESRLQTDINHEDAVVLMFSPVPESNRDEEQKIQGSSTAEQTFRDLDIELSASRAQSKTTLTELLDTLRQLEEPELLPEIKTEPKDKYQWIDGDTDNSLTVDNLERLGQLTHNGEKKEEINGVLLSEAKLQSIISFLDEMEQSEQERPQSAASNTQKGVQQRELTVRHVKQTEKELGQQLKQQSEQYEATIQRHLSFIDQEMKKLQDLMSATERVRREKWIDEKTKKIKEITVKGLEPEIQRLISKHKQEIRKLKALHEAELQQSDERAAQRYVCQAEEMRQNLEREKEEVSQRERELAKQRYEKHLVQEEQSLQDQRRRLFQEVSEEKERLNQQAARQRAELDELRKQLENNCALATRVLKEEYEKSKDEQERRHQAEIKALKERLDIEKQAWEQNYIKKEEAWLLSRERELKEEVRKGRDKEIEHVIQRLESEMSTTKEECERAGENRIKRIRDKYDSELQELERSERKLQQRCNQLKERVTELEGEQIQLQGLLRQKEQEVEDIRKFTDRLSEERKSLSEVIRQEFADRLVLTEEENRHLKTEASEARARHRLELERVNREKDEELEEVHKRVKTAIVKKEETVNSLRKQCEAAVKRADHLEALLDQQRKQLLAK